MNALSAVCVAVVHGLVPIEAASSTSSVLNVVGTVWLYTIEHYLQYLRFNLGISDINM